MKPSQSLPNASRRPSCKTAGLAAAMLVSCVAAISRGTEEPSGEYYDYTVTMKPERPWLLPYDRTLVTKMFLCSRDGQGGVDHVYLTFDQALEAIRRLDRITAGIPKIIYLVGWQHNGHDSKYPDWSVVNSALKRPGDATALDSLRWLIREGGKYHTRVSLHINMIDAYEDSPLWQSYVDKDIIAKDGAGNVIFGPVWNGMRSSQISYTREWELGLAQKRIDGLIAMIPELARTATIHIDAFHSARPAAPDQPISPYLGHSVATEASTQRKIYRYWRNKGFDVTSEGATFFRPDGFVGLQPFSWMNETIVQSLPDSLYTSTPMQAEAEIRQDPVNMPGLMGQFCRSVMPWHFLNTTGAAPAVEYNTGSGDTLLPAGWKDGLTLVAYSQNGYTNREWTLPRTWQGVSRAKVVVLSPTAPENPEEIPVNNGRITLSLGGAGAKVITAVDAPAAQDVSLFNPSFEQPVTPLHAVPAGWNTEAGKAFTHPSAGGLVPTEGTQALALGNTTGVTDQVSQTIPGGAGSMIYSLRFRIGWRNDDPNAPAFPRAGGVRVESGGAILTEKIRTFSAANGDKLGEWATVSTTFTTPAGINPNLGLKVVIFSTAANNIQTWFDQVELVSQGVFKITGINWSDSDLSLRWNSEPERFYRLESSPDLASWSSLADPVTSGGFQTGLTFPAPGAERMFFRVALNSL